MIIDEESTKAIYKQIVRYIGIAKEIGLSRDIAVVVGGTNLAKIMKESSSKKLVNAFMELNDFSSVVLACRVSPKQKA